MTLEYASSVWDLYYAKDIKEPEQIQWKAVTFIVWDYESKHEVLIRGKMKELNLLPLQESYLQLDTSRWCGPKPTTCKDYVILKSANKLACKI